MESGTSAHTDIDRHRGDQADKIGHTFAINWLAEEGASKFLCVCIRCKWSFKADRQSGAVLALDERGEPMSGAEGAHRVQSFAKGPCPAFSRLPEYARATNYVAHPGLFSRLTPILQKFGLAA